MFFSPIPTIFKLVRDLNKTNVLTNFHDDWAKIVTSRVENCNYIHIEKNALVGGHAKIVTSRVFTRKTAPPTGGHVFQRIGTTFELNQDIIKTNILTNFELGRNFIGTKLLTKFHEDGTRNQMITDGRTYDGQRPVTKAHLSNQFNQLLLLTTDINVWHTAKKNAPPHWKPYQSSDQISEDWTINVASRVLTRKNSPPLVAIGHAFLPIRTIFELNCHRKKTHVLTKFHEHWTKNVTSRTIFELVQEINKTNVSTNFHDDWAKIVTFRVFTRKTAPPTGGHVFQHTGTTFELNQDIIKTNILTNFELGGDFIGAKLLTKFHEDGTRNVASKGFTSKCLRTDGLTTDKDRSEKLT
ncbi:hypothetical protein DPMN_100739 [Dreissena polymorpha]|uniref:Uncharacterized protein n=1 Tax=Dreissena polymorpha TaxID=45954 RepID=A0A9D4R9F4_DREPO|nr:hypothetical protein DPMN_100739 [Dreissena polymorpha]